MRELIRVSRYFHLSQLETICQNVQNDEEFLNPSIGTYLNDASGKEMKDLFLNQLELADIAFEVEGTLVFISCCSSAVPNAGFLSGGGERESVREREQLFGKDMAYAQCPKHKHRGQRVKK